MNQTRADRLVTAIRARGSDAEDVRDAAHEACHALDVGLADGWDRESIHAALMRRSIPSKALVYEVHARAVEQQVCRALRVPYDAKAWAHIAWMETLKNGGMLVPAGFFSEAVKNHIGDERVKDLVARVLALGEVKP